VPQQQLAISTLAVYASCCLFFVVVAPDAPHGRTGERCNATSYAARGWCRLEQWSRLIANGAEYMYVFDDAGLVPIDAAGEWFSRTIFVLEGYFSVQDDRRKLVDTVLALWAVMLTTERTSEADDSRQRLLALVLQHRRRVVPPELFDDLVDHLELLCSVALAPEPPQRGPASLRPTAHLTNRVLPTRLASDKILHAHSAAGAAEPPARSGARHARRCDSVLSPGGARSHEAPAVEVGVPPLGLAASFKLGFASAEGLASSKLVELATQGWTVGELAPLASEGLSSSFNQSFKGSDKAGALLVQASEHATPLAMLEHAAAAAATRPSPASRAGGRSRPRARSAPLAPPPPRPPRVGDGAQPEAPRPAGAPRLARRRVAPPVGARLYQARARHQPRRAHPGAPPPHASATPPPPHRPIARSGVRPRRAELS
jgi:hypothetical protein